MSTRTYITVFAGAILAIGIAWLSSNAWLTAASGTNGSAITAPPEPEETVSFSAGAYSVGEAAGTAQLSVVHTGAFAFPVTVRIAQTAGNSLLGLGNLDSSFTAGTGFDGPVRSVVRQNDGHLIVGGEFNSFNGVARSKIARLNADGSLDTAFHPGAGANNTINATALQSDGKVIVGTQLSRIRRSTSARFPTRPWATLPLP